MNTNTINKHYKNYLLSKMFKYSDDSVLKYLYTNEIEIHHENFKEIATISSHFLITKLVDELKIWLIRHPECENWRKYITL